MMEEWDIDPGPHTIYKSDGEYRWSNSIGSNGEDMRRNESVNNSV